MTIPYKTLKVVYFSGIVFCVLVLAILNPISAEQFFSQDGLSIASTKILTFVSLVAASGLLAYILGFWSWNRGYRRLPEFLAMLTLSGVSIMAVCLVAETVFRVGFMHLLTPDIYAYNESFGMSYNKPNLDTRIRTEEYDIRYRTNSIGLRDEREFGPKALDETRILLVGDSMVQAAQVDLRDTASFQFEALLDKGHHSDLHTVINLSRSGWTPTEEREFLENNVALFQPDVVFMFICIANDISETMIRDLVPTRIEGVDGAFRALTQSLLSPNNPIKVGRFIAERLQKPWPMGRPNQPFYFRSIGTSGNVFADSYSEELDQAWTIVLDEIVAVRNLAAAREFKFHLVLVPTKEQVQQQALFETLEFMNLNPGDIDLKKPQSILRQTADREEILVLDLLTSLREAATVTPMYFPKDMHWNADGNRVVAQTLYRYFTTVRGGT